MKKGKLRALFSYWIDFFMSKGPATMIILLFAAMITAVGIIGLIAFLVDGSHSLGYQLWMSLMHTLDAGTLAGNSTENIPYVVMMSVATLCGLFVTSTLIGVIASGVEARINDLRKGTSVVQEAGHTTIIGFDDNVFTLLSELVEANANQKSACVVVLGTQPKEEMEDAILSRIPNSRTTRIICRSGGLHEIYSFQRCAIEHSKSIIVNINDDTDTIKTILALSSYLKENKPDNDHLRIVASIQEKCYVEAACLAGDGRAEVIFAKDTIARIIANTCRHHGLSQVLMELFDFGGCELYLESVPSLAGKTLKEATLSFSNAIVVGLSRDGLAQLNPPMDTVIRADDRLVLLEEDDGAYELLDTKQIDESQLQHTPHVAIRERKHLLILGSNDKLPMILTEYDQYVAAGTEVVIVDDDLGGREFSGYQNLEISICSRPVTQDLLYEYLCSGMKNVLLLNDDSLDAERSDSQTLLRLILLRDIADKSNLRFSITTEMRITGNQKLASQARVDDFVIGTNFVSLLMTQISECPEIRPVITDLLDEDGSELYMKPASHYVPLGQPVNSYILAESAAQKGEIYIGYRKNRGNVVVNPNKTDILVFQEEDLIIVIAED